MRGVRRALLGNSPMLLGILGGLGLGAIVLELSGTNCLQAYSVLLSGSWGSKYGITQTIQKMVPLSLVGLGLSVSFSSRLINIGGEGQIIAGGIAGSVVATSFGYLPPIILIPFMMLAGMVAGAAWVLVPALLRTLYRVDEVITTLMFNYLAIWLLDYLVRGPLTDPAAPGVEQGRAFGLASKLPVIIQGTNINVGVLVVLAAVALVYVLLWRTARGYEFRAIGVNLEASRYGGISLISNTLLPLFISGAMAGLAGILELAGVHGRLVGGFSSNYGYTAIAVALLARLNPVAVVVSALLFSTLLVGGDAMQYDLGVPTDLSMMIMAAIVVLIICGDTLRERLAAYA